MTQINGFLIRKVLLYYKILIFIRILLPYFTDVIKAKAIDKSMIQFMLRMLRQSWPILLGEFTFISLALFHNKNYLFNKLPDSLLQMATNLFAVANKQLPLTFVYSGLDSDVETEVSEELARALKLKPEDFMRLDADNNLTHLGK
mgnify:CR=1 FL=1